MSSVGESVARDRLARLSMMRFTHSIWTADKGEAPRAREPPQAVRTATMFTTSCTTQTQCQRSINIDRLVQVILEDSTWVSGPQLIMALSTDFRLQQLLLQWQLSGKSAA